MGVFSQTDFCSALFSVVVTLWGIAVILQKGYSGHSPSSPAAGSLLLAILVFGELPEESGTFS